MTELNTVEVKARLKALGLFGLLPRWEQIADKLAARGDHLRGARAPEAQSRAPAAALARRFV